MKKSFAETLPDRGYHIHFVPADSILVNLTHRAVHLDLSCRCADSHDVSGFILQVFAALILFGAMAIVALFIGMIIRGFCELIVDELRELAPKRKQHPNPR